MPANIEKSAENGHKRRGAREGVGIFEFFRAGESVK
jgi:hypothetical protein